MLFIANYHALTTVIDAGQLRCFTYDVAASWLAAGLDPERVVFYRQSDVPETFELFWLLCCTTPKGMMNRAHAYKAIVDEDLALGRATDAHVNMGTYGYPILMAADILLFDANLVPVGTDQTQHVEMARDIAQRFNRSFGPVLTVPELLLSCDHDPFLGIDGRKMSKSFDNAIPLFASSDELQKLLGAYKTDSTDARAPKDPGTNGLFSIYAEFVDAEKAAAVRKALLEGDMSWADLKCLTFETVDEELSPLRQRYDRMRDDVAMLEHTLTRGGARRVQLHETPCVACATQ